MTGQPCALTQSTCASTPSRIHHDGPATHTALWHTALWARFWIVKCACARAVRVPAHASYASGLGEGAPALRAHVPAAAF
eukprot:3461679-Alexandrium_andersonii.AAC.1